VSFYDTEPDYADPGRLRDALERVDPPTCDECGKTEIRISLQGVGLFCSERCANRGCLKHERAMQKASA
jgi:hypothetical protein